ncbi:MAG: HU family DNA-binding protein [Mediterranea sp.]|jgi:predicted histone-like DNA-binding protein|nr:HU family DNA-binding protein [Mediterranea sp.]
MSIYYDLYTSGNPLKREEKQSLHARVIPSGTIEGKRLVKLVAQRNAFSEATIEGCLQAVADELRDWLAQGYTVEVPELGHFSLSLRCDRPVMEKKEIRSPSIHLNRVNLRVNKRLKESLERLELERMESPYRSGSTLSDEECRDILLKHLDEQGCITRADFKRLTGVSQDRAFNLLHQFIEEGIIRKYGGGKTTVYLKGR